MGENALITLQQVLIACAEADRPLAANTFRTYVAKGLAPAPAHRQGRVALWEATQVRSWAAGGLGSLAGQHAAELYARANPTADASSPLAVRAEHLVRLDDTLSAHEAAVKLEADLVDRLAMLADEVARIETLMGRQLAHQRASGPAEGAIVGRILRRCKAAHEDRARQLYLQALAEQLAAARAGRDAAKANLTATRSWIAGLLVWAQNEQARRHKAVLEQEAAAERSLDLSGCVSEAQFVRQDHRRLAWFTPDGELDRAEVLARIDAGADPKVRLVLEGADFGYRWRLDGTDRPHRSGSAEHAAGTWRVSWINSTSELYAHNPRHHQVLLLGATPPTSLSTMIAWLAPMERHQSQRNSLAMLAEAVTEQREAGFPNLTTSAWLADLPQSG